MKKFMLSMFLMASVTAQASDCSLYLNVLSEAITGDQIALAAELLPKKGYTLVDAKEKATFNFEVYGGQRSGNRSTWFVSGRLNNQTQGEYGEFYDGGDLLLTIPTFFLTFGVSAFINTKGTIAMTNMLYKLPACGIVEEEEYDLYQN